MSVEDDILVYGDEAAIEASIEAKDGIKAAASLASNGEVVDRLAQIGWRPPLVGTVALGGDPRSLRMMITGSTGPRAVSFGVRGNRGIEVRAVIDAASPSAGQELAKLLDEKRAGAADLPALVGQDFAASVASIAKDATSQGESRDRASRDRRARPERVGRLGIAGGVAIRAPRRHVQRSRLVQLLAPTP